MPQAAVMGVITTGAMRDDLFRDGLIEVFGMGVESVDQKIAKIYHRKKSSQNYEAMMGMAGIGHFGLWPERKGIAYQSIGNRYKSIFRHLDYATGLVYSRVVKRDLKYGVIADAAKQFGMASAATQEMLGSDLFNTGFSEVWNAEEGQPLFSAAHPLDARTGGKTYSNLVTGGLSNTTLETAITQMLLTPNDMGFPMHIKAKTLWVHPSKYWLAKRILDSPGEYDNANNVVNTLKGMLKIETWEYLTSTDAWFLQGDQYRTYWFDRESLQQGMESDFDTGDLKHKAWFASSCGAADWRGWIGSAGA